jgi:hypothetical protein
VAELGERKIYLGGSAGEVRQRSGIDLLRGAKDMHRRAWIRGAKETLRIDELGKGFAWP